jgi:hypothetical protein
MRTVNWILNHWFFLCSVVLLALMGVMLGMNLVSGVREGLRSVKGIPASMTWKTAESQHMGLDNEHLVQD